MKQVEVDRFFIMEKLDRNVIEIPRVKSEDQLVNVLTKTTFYQTVEGHGKTQGIHGHSQKFGRSASKVSIDVHRSLGGQPLNASTTEKNAIEAFTNSKYCWDQISDGIQGGAWPAVPTPPPTFDNSKYSPITAFITMFLIGNSPLPPPQGITPPNLHPPTGIS
ncbi:hypothetical protein DVH24_022113 [Malus domestica]|uniref:Uncharacterized protein n=1 Tax=Malus domestica TaxID=3750 RepID=A0A498IUH4_MALDO|nr:hypothetical protein DVH24_022113 [Malus domestica]